MPFEYVTSWPLVISVALVMGAFISIAFLSNRGSLNGFKARQVGDGQHGTARWATKKEISKEYLAVPFLPQLWRKGKKRPKKQGLVVGSISWAFSIDINKVKSRSTTSVSLVTPRMKTSN